MSTHTYTLADPTRADAIIRACERYGRPPTIVEPVITNTLTMTFVPDLTTAELALLDDLVAAYGTVLTLAEYRAIKDDVAGLATYLGLASPTSAQTVLAVKALIRVLRAVVRS